MVAHCSGILCMLVYGASVKMVLEQQKNYQEPTQSCATSTFFLFMAKCVLFLSVNQLALSTTRSPKINVDKHFLKCMDSPPFLIASKQKTLVCEHKSLNNKSVEFLYQEQEYVMECS